MRHWFSGKIAAFQAVAPSSILGWRMLFCVQKIMVIDVKYATIMIEKDGMYKMRHWFSGKIAAFQAVAPSSILGWRIPFCIQKMMAIEMKSARGGEWLTAAAN